MDQAAEEALVAPLQRVLDPIEAAERAAMAEHYAAPPDARPWRPGDPDPLRDGLLAGWRAGQRLRLGALVQRLHDARPKQRHGVRRLDFDAWTVAAREAAGLPSGEWLAWRATIGTAAAGWPPRPPAPPPTGGVHR